MGKLAATESHLSSELAGYRRWGRDGYRHADAELCWSTTATRKPPGTVRVSVSTVEDGAVGLGTVDVAVDCDI